MRILNKNLDFLAVAQYLVIGGLVSITISPPLANLFLGLSVIATLFIATIRNQLLAFFKTKLGYACTAFILIIFSGIFYGIESNKVIATSIYGWGKFMMLPIAAAIFMNAPQAKQKLINVFWFACILLAIYSFLHFFIPTFSTKNTPPGIVVRNHATQGLFFSVAVIIAFFNYKYLKNSDFIRILSAISIPFFIVNISMISTGRSGYVALIVMLISFVLIVFKQLSLIKKFLISILILFILVSTFLMSSASNQRIEQAKDEFSTGINTPEFTSVGLRLIFWKNTIELAPNYFLIGTGAGGFEKAYAKHVSKEDGVAATITGDPHNQYLKILIEHGVIGLIIFMLIIFLLFKQKNSSPYKLIGIPVLLAICCTSLVNSHFSTFNEGQLIWILAGSLLASESHN